MVVLYYRSIDIAWNIACNIMCSSLLGYIHLHFFLRLGKIFHDWKEKLEDVTKCIGRVQSSSGIASTLSTESRNLNLSKLSSHSTLGTPSPISPRFGRPRRKVERNLETVVEKPASETQEEKEVVEAREMKENDEQEKKEEKKVQEEFEEDTDFESMTVDELAIELESWYYNFSYTLDGIDSNLVEEASRCILASNREQHNNTSKNVTF